MERPLEGVPGGRRRSDDAAYWDERSKTFTVADAPSTYVEDFLRLAAIRPGETVLDMGCGTGALSIPLGAVGHKVVAADFSAGMLGVMERTLAEKAIASVRPVQMSWEDDWEAHGVGEKSVDVCVASRSMAVADLQAALDKLGRTARRRVCVTLATGSSPRMDNRVFRVMGLPEDVARDYLFAFNMLADGGFAPRWATSAACATIAFPRGRTRGSAIGRWRSRRWTSWGHRARAAALARLERWLDEQLVPAGDEAGAPAKLHGAREDGGAGEWLRLKDPQITTWAFVAWDVER